MPSRSGAASIGPLRVYLDHVARLIPAELTAAYIAVQSYLGVENPDQNAILLFFTAVVLTSLVPFYLVLVRRLSWKKGWRKIAVSTLSFPFWALNISIYYVAYELSFYVDIDKYPYVLKIPILLLVVWALVTPLLVSELKPK